MVNELFKLEIAETKERIQKVIFSQLNPN